MNIEIKNLAHIDYAQLEDVDFMVLIGDNGSGKTLLLEALAYLKKNAPVEMQGIYNSFLKEHKDLLEIEWNKDLISEELTDYANGSSVDNNKHQLKHVLNNVKVTFTFQDVDLINTYFERGINKLSLKLTEGINKNVLLKNESDLILTFNGLPTYQSKYECTFDLHTFENIEYSILQLTYEKMSYRQSMVYRTSKYNFEEGIDSGIQLNLFNVDEYIDSIEKKLKQLILSLVYSEYFVEERTLFLPSERNVFMENALTKASISSLEQKFENGNLLKQRYSERLFNSEYLRYLDLTKRMPKIMNHSKEKIEPLIEGELIVSEEGEIESIIEKNGMTIQRPLFSTKQNRVIPYLLIHSPVDEYKFIIIEEPEAHMSLKSMIALVRHISKLIDLGIKIYLSTHSDVFFQRLNNLLFQEHTEKNVGIYEIITIKGKNKVIRRSKGDFGYKIDLFTKELELLYNETLYIQNKLRE